MGRFRVLSVPPTSRVVWIRPRKTHGSRSRFMPTEGASSSGRRERSPSRSGGESRMSKARQAAEERYPDGVVGNLTAREGFEEGVAWALPEVPDPAVIEAIKRAICGQIAF